MWVRIVCSLIVFFALCDVPVQSAERDFIYLETERALREEPSSSQTPARFFALGEYQFDLGNLQKSEEYFRRSRDKSPAGTQEYLVKVYLSEIRQRLTGENEPAELSSLKAALTRQPFFTMSGKTKKQAWSSLLGTRYEVKESVDRVEVYRNGTLFYVIRLP